MSSKMDEAVYECRLCPDLDYVPHPGLAHEDQEDEDSLQAVDGVEQDNLPTFKDKLVFFITVLTLMMEKTKGQTELSM